MVYATCRRILKNPAEAEDVTQECFELLALTEKGPKEHMAGWLHTVATSRSLRRIRDDQRRKRREAEFTALHDAHEHVAWKEVYGLVDEAIEALPEKFRIPLVAHFLLGASHQAIANELGLSRRGAGHRIRKGLELVRRTLKRKGVTASAGALVGAMASGTAEAAPVALIESLGKLAIATSIPSGPVAGGMAASGLAVAGGLALMTKKVLVGIAAVALILGVIYTVSPRNEPTAPPALSPAPSQDAVEKPPPAPASDAPISASEEGAEDIKESGTPRASVARDVGTTTDLEDILEEFKHALQGRNPGTYAESVHSSDIPQENGAHYFLLAWEQFSDEERDLVGDKMHELGLAAWQDPEIQALIASHQDALDYIRIGVEMGNAMLPLDPNGPYAALPYLAPYRGLAKLLVLEARAYGARGDYGAALADYSTVLGFGNELPRGGTAIHALVGYAVNIMATEALTDLLGRGDLPPEAYRTVIDEMQRLDERAFTGREAQAYEGQAWDSWWVSRLDEGADLRTLIDEVYTLSFDAEVPDETRNALAGLSDAEIRSLFDGYLEDRQALIEYASLPYYEAAAIDPETIFGDNAMSQFWLRGLVRLNRAEARNYASFQGTAVVAAVELCRAEQNAYPATLSELTPNYLATLPEDPFTGNSFRYDLTESGYVLYSPGMDMEDNGGVQHGQGDGEDLVFHSR